MFLIATQNLKNHFSNIFRNRTPCDGTRAINYYLYSPIFFYLRKSRSLSFEFRPTSEKFTTNFFTLPVGSLSYNNLILEMTKDYLSEQQLK